MTMPKNVLCQRHVTCEYNWSAPVIGSVTFGGLRVSNVAAPVAGFSSAAPGVAAMLIWRPLRSRSSFCG